MVPKIRHPLAQSSNSAYQPIQEAVAPKSNLPNQSNSIFLYPFLFACTPADLQPSMIDCPLH